MNSLTINFRNDVNINEVYIQLRQLYPDVEIINNYNNIDNIDDLLFASESSLDFWNNDIDDEVWNNA